MQRLKIFGICLKFTFLCLIRFRLRDTIYVAIEKFWKPSLQHLRHKTAHKVFQFAKKRRGLNICQSSDDDAVCNINKVLPLVAASSTWLHNYNMPRYFLIILKFARKVLCIKKIYALNFHAELRRTHTLIIMPKISIISNINKAK